MSARTVSRGIFTAFAFLFLTVALHDSFVTQCNGSDVADLREQLESGLKAHRPQEFQFIARVVNFVDTNRLPLPLVKGTYKWAIKRAGLSKQPYPYFERGMRINAARIGVRL